jgi:hypothetical protein
MPVVVAHAGEPLHAYSQASLPSHTLCSHTSCVHLPHARELEDRMPLVVMLPGHLIASG